MKLLLLLSIITTLTCFAGEQEVRTHSVIPFVEMPEQALLDDYYDALALTKNDSSYEPEALLQYFAHILPALRYESHVYTTSISAMIFSDIEFVSFELAELMLNDQLLNPTTEAAIFEHKRIIMDASDIADHTNDTLPKILSEIQERNNAVETGEGLRG